MRARRVRTAWLGELIADLPPETMLQLLPEDLRTHGNAAQFVANVRDSAARARFRQQGKPKGTQKERRQTLVAAANQAHKMQHCLTLSFADDSDGRSDLECFAEYVIPRWRAGTAGDPARPAIPSGPASTPDLPNLLARLQADLQALRALCDGAARDFKPDRNPSKHVEADLASSIAAWHVVAFGFQPAPRGWFGDFVSHVGELVGFKEIGSIIVTKAVGKSKTARRSVP
jgi:hypothetical protein